MKSHDSKQSQADFTQVLPQQYIGNSWLCMWVCIKSWEATYVHRVDVNDKDEIVSVV